MNIDLYAGNNTLLLTLTGLTNASTGAYINDATVVANIYFNGTIITGETFPLTMAATGSPVNGNYAATLSANSEIRKGRKYKIVITVTSGANTAEFTEEVFATERNLNEN